MMVQSDIYSISATYHDEGYSIKENLVDLDFYVDLARKIGGPVLELACGTGRVLLPIARQGIAIHGLDSSPSMLDVLRKKWRKSPRTFVSWLPCTKATSGVFVPIRSIRW